MKIGYARVSTLSQNLDSQLDALRAENCDRIFAEKASGTSLAGRPELGRAIDALAVDDILVIASWDRATRSLYDGLDIIRRVAERHALIKVLDREHFDLTTATGRGVIALLSGIAEDERKRINDRAAAGRRAAKKRGRHLGRPLRFPKGTEARAEIETKLQAGASCSAIGRLFSADHKTIARIKREMEQA